jgi:hypothetical protein
LDSNLVVRNQCAIPVARRTYLAGPLAHCVECHTHPLPGDRHN